VQAQGVGGHILGRKDGEDSVDEGGGQQHIRSNANARAWARHGGQAALARGEDSAGVVNWQGLAGGRQEARPSSWPALAVRSDVVWEVKSKAFERLCWPRWDRVPCEA